MEMDCLLHAINGTEDHVHMLIQLDPKVPVADFFKSIKGSSSHYLNKQAVCSEKFQWSTGYAAFSVSRSVVPRVHKYIRRQKEHHAHKTYKQELIELELAATLTKSEKEDNTQ
jgi:REP element-mobilizing transposase RayT